MPMLVEQARQVAGQWVAEEGAGMPGFLGAFLAGSVLWARGDETLAPWSDVDVTVVSQDTAQHAGKFRYNGVLLEVSTLSMAELGSPQDVLSHYHLAGGFHRPSVLADPTGRLGEIQRVVSRDFAEKPWILARCAQAMDAIRGRINRMDPADPPAEQATSWLFGTGGMPHVLLVAALRNPTVRGRYPAVRDLLAAHHRLDCYERLLDLLGCAELDAARVRGHLAALEEVYDAAAPLAAPAYRFASDVSAVARPIAIDGSRDLIERGLHREAVFWIVATYARCLLKLAAAGAHRTAYERGFRALLADLGAETFRDRRRRGDHVLAALPDLWQTAMSLC
ncbi:hypothetical protein HII36_31180 [Nonomuraea sp. NN258]|uniref:hypothetical protein n=1 Tax=Nonomuraea antri TaxID=2730852 RepID=UPI0015682CA1|nr:hypothetical protein [Nonomuraea antri]NRQ36264.1 hypothetical protein [Nonomuraea antri]